MQKCDDYQRSVRGCQGALPLASMALGSLELSTTFRQLHVSSNVFHHLFSSRKLFELRKASNHSDKLAQLSGVIVFLPRVLWRVPIFFWRPYIIKGYRIFTNTFLLLSYNVFSYVRATFFRTKNANKLCMKLPALNVNHHKPEIEPQYFFLSSGTR